MSKQVALITGVLTGIGRATAVAFAAAGANVVVAGRREEDGKKLEKELRHLGGRSGVCKGRRSARASLPAGLLPGRRTGDSSGPLRPETVYADSDWTFDAGASPGYGAAHAITLRAAPRYSGFVDETVLHAAGFERRIDHLRSYHHFTLCKRVVRRAWHPSR